MEQKNADQTPKDNNTPNSSIKTEIIDLQNLAKNEDIKNSDIILSILEICTFNKKYNYDCSNNTIAFWDRVVDEDILKKIFKNFKAETLRKYWKIMRNAGNTEKLVEAVRRNEKFINNPVFKLLPLVNAIAYFIQTDEKNFEEFFMEFNSKTKKSPSIKIEKPDKKDKKEKNSINLLGNKRPEPDNDFDESQILIVGPKNENDEEIDKSKLQLKKPIFAKSEDEPEQDKRMLEFEDIVNKLMVISKLSREEVCVALYGTSYNIKNAYLYMKNNEKYEKYFFLKTDDYVIKNMKDKGYYKDLVALKGKDLVEEREKFLGIKK